MHATKPDNTPGRRRSRSLRKNARQLTQHDDIRRWAEARQGQPATVRGTGGTERVGILRIRFPDYEGKTDLEAITWEEFFKKFDERQLALLCQESTSDGALSRYWKLVKRSDVATPSDSSVY